MQTQINNAPGTDSPDPCLVIGSGLAAIAAAKALLDRGQRVRILDPGISLESDRATLVQRLSQLRPEQWSKADIAAYQANMNPDVGGVPLKLVFGSDFAYRDADAHLGTSYDNVGLRPSFARGGLSNVWGAAMMPYLESDMQGWPFGRDRLAPHYKAVLDFTGLAALQDDLAAHFPLFTDNLTSLQLSRQANHLVNNLQRYSAELKSCGIAFGQSRIAVRGSRGPGANGCCYCRLCMYGCPYDFIYSSSHTLADLTHNPLLTYEAGSVVTRLQETGTGVEVQGYELQTRGAKSWRANRVFLAAGTIASTRILLESLRAFDQTVYLKDSQYFLIPLLMPKRIKGAVTEPLHSLSQVFLELLQVRGLRHSVHLQVYTNSDLLNQAIANTAGPLKKLLTPVLPMIQERLLVGQGFLHSNHSSRIAVTLRKGSESSSLELRGDVNPEARKAVREVVSTLLRNGRRIGLWPVLPMVKVADPGRSFHTGGSFPMSLNPGRFETNLQGSPTGFSRVHVVDSTVLPSIPATTISLSVMANAHRIASETSD